MRDLGVDALVEAYQGNHVDQGGVSGHEHQERNLDHIQSVQVSLIELSNRSQFISSGEAGCNLPVLQ